MTHFDIILLFTKFILLILIYLVVSIKNCGDFILYLDIKKYRLAKKFTQKQLAKKVKISQSYLSKLENNKKIDSMRLGLIKDIAKALDTTPKAILKFKQQ